MNDASSLACWIGHTDLWAMVRDQPGFGEEVKRLTGRSEPPRETGLGPIKTLTSQRPFERVDLISNYPEPINEAFARWLDVPYVVYRRDLKNPTNYSEVFQVSSEVLEQVSAKNKRTGRALAIHLSPGTPTMTAVLVLLGKTRYPATLYQTHGGSVIETSIPFDLELFVSKFLEEPDSLIHSLSFEAPSEVRGFEDIVGQSTLIKIAVDRAKRAAIRNYNVLLIGESGTGKELFARAIHAASQRRLNPLLSVNCAAIPENLLESELFGHVKGAFTGAERTRTGAFENADGGTLFLDEVGECDPLLQAKLLRVLQPPRGKGPCHREYQRVGETTSQTSEVRLVAATNRALLDRVKENQFREDLYYRLATIVIRIPPLRERQKDIRFIAEDTMARINGELRDSEPGYKEKRLSEPAYRRLIDYSWPGNVRQLNNVLTQAAVMAFSDVIGLKDVEAGIAETLSIAGPSLSIERTDGFVLDQRLSQIERRFIEDALEEAGWPRAHGSKAQATRLLGLKSQQDLSKRLVRLDIQEN